jgi:hypothetical protein
MSVSNCLSAGALHRRAGQTTVVVSRLAQTPPFSLLTPDVCLTRLALGMQGVEVLLKAFFR